jgi:predicted TIM-barrel fold metal-dependent hydrolase
VFPYHPNRSYTPPDAPKEHLRALHDHLGIERAVIVQASCHGTYNDVVLDAIAFSDGRYRGVAVVDDTFSVDALRRMDDGGIRGVRFNFVKHLEDTPDPDVFDRVIERIEPLGWHVVLHLDAADIVEHEERFRALPMPIVIDHMARVPTADGLEQEPFKMLLRFMENPNTWVKITGAERISAVGPPFHDAVPFAQALIAAAPDRVLWGTDFPHPNITRHMPNDGDLVDLLALYAPDPETRKRILVDNPARLYGFE